MTRPAPLVVAITGASGAPYALKLLEAKHGEAYESQYAALRGDALLAKDQRDEARAAYKLALDKAAREQGGFRESVRMRLEALGG